MISKCAEEQSISDRRLTDSAVASESMRSADIGGRATDAPPHSAKKSTEERISFFWQVFGGTILSIAALIAITLYNNIASNISELRAEVSRVNEVKGEFAKKDDVMALKVQVTTFAAYRAEIDGLKERAGRYRTELEDAKKELRGNIESARKDETLVTDSLKKDLAAVEVMKERMALLAADVKSTRDEVLKARADVERRDAQLKEMDESLKELAKALQATREKVARLEGQQGPTKPSDPTPPPSSPPK